MAPHVPRRARRGLGRLVVVALAAGACAWALPLSGCGFAAGPARTSRRPAGVDAPTSASGLPGSRRGHREAGRPEEGEQGPSAPEAERAQLGTLWEQWGLLGLAVGLFFAFGAFDGLMLGAGFDTPDIEAASQELGGALAAMTTGVMSGVEPASVVQEALVTAREDPEAVVEGEAAAATLLGDEVLLGAAAASLTEKLGLPVGLGAAGGLAGLLADTAREPVRERDGRGYLAISELTPGTTHGSGDGLEDRPLPALQLAAKNFQFEFKQLLRAARLGGKAPRRHVPSFVASLVLSNEAVMERERARPEVPTPLPVRVVYDALCWFIDVVFEDRPIQRFWFLETVARMPYFAYLSVLHLYETFGWWRSPELRAVHAAEEDNELHHLLIMESLGGDQRWLDRFYAQHGALVYYWILILFFIVDPRWSYNFSRLIEAHAVDTYGEFVDANAEQLRRLPPPPVAVEYYLGGDCGDWYLFDKFQTALQREGKIRRPPCSTLYDVFRNICDDEEQHVLTMEACEEWVTGASPAVALGFNRLSEEEVAQRVTQTPEGRAAWDSWGAEVNRAARESSRVG